MNAWRRPRTAANIAKMLLFVWLFAIVASWANACLLAPRGDHAGAASGHAAVLATGTADTSDHDHGRDPGRAACQDLCDETQGAIPKHANSSDSGPMAAPMIACALWSLSVFGSSLPRERPPAAAPPPERPVAIRLLRLTI